MVEIKSMAEDRSITVLPLSWLFFRQFPFRITLNHDCTSLAQQFSKTLAGEHLVRTSGKKTYLYLTEEQDVVSVIERFTRDVTELVAPLSDQEFRVLEQDTETEITVIASYLFWNRYRYCCILKPLLDDYSFETAIETLTRQLVPEDDFRCVYSSRRRVYFRDRMGLDVFLFLHRNLIDYIEKRVLRNELPYQYEAT